MTPTVLAGLVLAFYFGLYLGVRYQSEGDRRPYLIHLITVVFLALSLVLNQWQMSLLRRTRDGWEKAAEESQQTTRRCLDTAHILEQQRDRISAQCQEVARQYQRTLQGLAGSRH